MTGPASSQKKAVPAMPAKPVPLRRELVTPEGIPLQLYLASAGDRAAAFLLDIFFLLLAVIVISFLATSAFTRASAEIVSIVWMLGLFILRNFYFVLFEIRPGAATPGKRIVGLRVTSRNGERLHAGAIIARNAMREIEFFMPLSFLFVRGDAVTGAIALMGLIWSGIFLLLPLFNRDRLRAGDIVAGTWVIRIPDRKLALDMAVPDAGRQLFHFSATELDAYGIHELQVLETVLRKADPNAVQAVAGRIRKKIERPRKNEEKDAEFLSAYYAALRKNLEGKLLFGVRRKDKFDRSE